MSDIDKLFNQDGAAAMQSLIERVRYLESLERGATGTGGGLGLRIRSSAVNTTVVSSDWTVLIDASTANITVALPAAADVYSSDSEEGQFFNVKKTDATANTVTIDPDGAETIDGAATLVILFQYDSCQFQSDGSNWHII